MSSRAGPRVAVRGRRQGCLWSTGALLVDPLTELVAIDRCRLQGRGRDRCVRQTVPAARTRTPTRRWSARRGARRKRGRNRCRPLRAGRGGSCRGAVAVAPRRPSCRRSSSSCSPSSSSCDRSALITSHTGLNAESSRAISGSSSVSMKTGMTMVPTVLSGASLMARPTACTMSTSERRGSMKATPSRVGTSTPSARQRALASSPRSPSIEPAEVLQQHVALPGGHLA